ncbi:hypothetical protein RHECNPAF_13300170 [Rhizobium etli CNPAF512]|nr:hypothetical protein RHECNPAF_13300170 [Rhizobium etli CNPAF512]
MEWQICVRRFRARTVTAPMDAPPPPRFLVRAV